MATLLFWLPAVLVEGALIFLLPGLGVTWFRDNFKVGGYVAFPMTAAVSGVFVLRWIKRRKIRGMTSAG